MSNFDRIFEVVEPVLYAVRWTGHSLDSFREAFRNWQDPEYLEQFFEENKVLLNNPFWRGVSVEEAVLRTIQESEEFYLELLGAVESVESGEQVDILSSVFIPLTKSEPLQKSALQLSLRRKVYGPMPSWLRLYAVALDSNCYVITGGAIKLTKKRMDLTPKRNSIGFWIV